MPKIKIAGIVIDIKRNNPILAAQINEYLCEDESCDICVDFGEDYIRNEIEEELKGDCNFSVEYSEYLAIYRYICTQFLNFDGFVMHGSAIACDNRAFMFCAPSGTGKSTHSRMWRETFGDKIIMVNDDKPIIRKINGNFYVSGTPWSGKHDLDTNITVPLKAICILGRAGQNSIERVNPESVLGLLFNQIYRPKESNELIKTIDLVGEMIGIVPVYRLNCNISHEAAVCAYNEFMKENGNEN